MEIQRDGKEGAAAAAATVKDMASQLESRIHSTSNTQLQLLASLQTLFPDLVPSIDLSLKVVSAFNHRPFTPVPTLPSPDPLPRKPSDPNRPPTPDNAAVPRSSNSKGAAEPSPVSRSESEKFSLDESNSPLSVVRSMVAVCLLERVPFTAIDSSTVLRKLENDQNATPAEKAALREVGGESGAILAVEMALRSMAEDNGGVELGEFVVSGKSRVMVLGIDRTRLLKELPESGQDQRQQQQQQESSSGDDNSNHNQNRGGQGIGNGGADVNGGIFGMGGPVRPMQDMWMGAGGDPHISGVPPMYPGGGPPGALMGPRGVPRVMGMMAIPRGISIPPMHRPPLVPNPSSLSQKPRTEEDDMKDLEALLKKKSFREMQKSKTGEELLDLIHRPTAKETAVAAKVLRFMSLLVDSMDALFCAGTGIVRKLFQFVFGVILQ